VLSKQFYGKCQLTGTLLVGLLALVVLSGPAFADDYPLQAASVANVTIEGGFWGPRVTTNATVTVSHNFKFIENTSRMAIFDQAAGTDTKPFAGDAYVGDSDVFKIIEGAAYSLQLRPDNVDAKLLARQVRRVIAAQQEDGFLCPRLTLTPPALRWQGMRKSHVLYSAGHLFEAGVAYWDATGNVDLLKTSARYADLIDSQFGPGKMYDVPGHQEIELALVKLYRATGERRYLDLCRFFLDQRGHIHGKNERVRGAKPRSADYNQDRVPLIEADHAVGHAVRAGYTYAAMTDIAALCDDHDYLHALDRIWKDVVERKLYITGASATAQYYDEGFGDPYYLPNDTAYCETCGTVAAVLWSHRMALLHADAAYVDVLERALYNGVLSGISLSGDRYFYTNPLASRGNMRRHESWNPACCQSNLVRIIPQVGSMAYATQAEAIYVNLFVAGKAALGLASGTVHLRLETDYPHNGRVRITVEGTITKPFTIALRIPGWARERPVPSELYHFANKTDQQPSVSIAGKTVAIEPVLKGYVRLTRTWKKGDVVELNLPMPVRRVLANERVEADRGRVALQRGPLVYCVEAVDNGGLRTDAIVLPDEANLQVVRRKDLLKDVVVITGDAAVAFEPRWGELAKVRPHTLVAIPYYAWANRDQDYMDVWLARTPSSATPLPALTDSATAKLSASAKHSTAQLAALTDGRSGPKSSFRPTPRFTWPRQTQGTQWIQYEWSQPTELSRAAVYWAVDWKSQVYWGERIRGANLMLPKTWRVLYRDSSAWRPVESPDQYTLRLDLFNEIRFRPVKTTAVRLEVVFDEAPCGIQEWLID
jgi:DUF1680 family protein